MADLTAKFSILDTMSEGISNIAQAGMSMAEQFERAGDEVSALIDGISSIAGTSVSVVDGVATSIDSLQGAANNAISFADTLTETMNSYSEATGEAAAQTDYWTNAVGNYDKSVLEAVYSTEELVNMGMKSAKALEEQERIFELCDQSASSLSKGIEATASIEEELSKTLEAASEATAELNNNTEVSAESKAKLANASTEAAETMSELSRAQNEAAAAMEAYDAVMISGTTDLTKLEAAAERAGHAAEKLAEANGKAGTANEELSKAIEKVSEEAEDGGKKGLDAIESIAGALASAGITAKIMDIASAAYELATAFSEAESTVVKATGASGEALNGLTASMMNAYADSKSGSLEDTAGAIGEINTRMALTGEELTDVTGKFLDYANITGTNVVDSVQNVTKIMNKWGVEGSEVESVLDKLAYAGQISGISVDTLSSNLITGAASFQEMGLSLDNSISMLAQFELYGMSGTTAITAMRTAVKGFADDGLDAEMALQCVINEIASMESQADATALAVETFGSRAGVDMANAIRSGAITVDTLTGSLEAAQGTLSSTAQTAQTLDQKWQQASNNIHTAFSKALQPAIDGISSAFAGVVNSLGKFLNEHPAVTKAITAIGIGLAVVVAGIAGVTFVTTVAIPAVSAFGVALNAALGPIGWVALAITGIVAAGTALIAMFSDAEDETADMTAVTRAQYYQLQDLNAEYEEACEKYGAAEGKALRLKYQIDDLSEAFEANRQTVEEFQKEVEELCNGVNNLWNEFDKSIAEINKNEVSALALIQKYDDLSQKAELTAGEQKQLEVVTESLTEKFPELTSKLDTATVSTEAYVEALRKAAEQEAAQLRQQEVDDTYVKALAEREKLALELAKAEENLRLEEEAFYNSIDLNWVVNKAIYKRTGWDPFNVTNVDEYEEALEQVKAAIATNDAEIAELERDYEMLAQIEKKAAEQQIFDAEAVSIAYMGVMSGIEEFCTAYDEAYQAALDSFTGQFGLFDEASMKSEEYTTATIKNAQKALDSQLAYWENYNANLQTLTEYGQTLTGEARESYEALLAYAQDGSKQAAGLANSMAAAIQNGDIEAIEALSSTVSKVSQQQEAAAAVTADFVTDFTSQMDEIEKEMQSTVDEMNLSDEAAASAKSTITSYADQIRAGKDGAVNAAKEVANAVTVALANANTTVNVGVSTSGSVPGHANGTTNTEDVFIAGEKGPELVARPAAAYANGTTDSTDYFIAGENGPELIVGQQGSTVFPTEETDRLISALNEKRRPLQVFADAGTQGGEKTTGEQVKHILLEIAGNGAIEVGGSGGVDKETILSILYEHLKPVLMNILQGEIYEEGELSYEY